MGVSLARSMVEKSTIKYYKMGNSFDLENIFNSTITYIRFQNFNDDKTNLNFFQQKLGLSFLISITQKIIRKCIAEKEMYTFQVNCYFKNNTFVTADNYFYIISTW